MKYMLHFYRRYNKTKDCFTIWGRNINLLGAMRLSAVVKVFLMAEVRQWQLRSRVSYISKRFRGTVRQGDKNDDKISTEGRSSNLQTPKERTQNLSEIKRCSVIRGHSIIHIGFYCKLTKHKQYAMTVTIRVTLNHVTTIWLLILSHR